MLDQQTLLADLTDDQRRAVTCAHGPLLVIAGAGSGKTRVITRRIAYLMTLGVPGPSIVAIAFTNKAAGEMKSRVSSLLGRPLYDFGQLHQRWPLICTFHSLCLRILRHYARQIDLPPNFTVYDADDQQRLLKQAVAVAEVDPSQFPPSRMQQIISAAKNSLQSPEGFAAAARQWPATAHARVYQHYQRLLRQNNALDFDDLLWRTAETFRAYPDILRELQERFEYLLIDEYQDTNHAQYVVAHALAQAHRNICVVGDPDQSIYAWRGADIRNILDFEKDYPDATVVRLEQNYRSTQNILDIASAVIANNRHRKHKRLWTDKGPGEPARLFICDNAEAEAHAIVAEFQRLAAQGFTWNQMAIFYRINALSRLIEDALRTAKVPYRVARGVDFYHRAEIKDALAYLRVIANPSDELSLGRIINVPPRGLGAGSIRLVQAHAVAHGLSFWDALLRVDEIDGMRPQAKKAIHNFTRMVRRWRTLAGRDAPVAPDEMPGSAAAPEGEAAQPHMGLRALLEHVVVSSGLEKHLKAVGGEEKSELANVAELISFAAQFEQERQSASLDDFLAQISLVSDVDTLAETGGAVTLLTLHAAKGLEFPVVAMIGMEEGCLPHSRVQTRPDDVEEERRLCFVGLTRAQQLLILSMARRRMIRGQQEILRPSRFLQEMPAELVQRVQPAGCASPPPAAGGLFRVGDPVRHPIFGRGLIERIDPMGGQTRVLVQFSSVGRKNLILEYARLEPAGRG